MALQKSIQFKPLGFSSEITISDAYCKVTKVTGDKSYIECQLSVFESKDQSVPLYSNTYMFVPNLDDNFIKQAYKNLKTLPEFAGSNDC
jgi:hypothetical protein